MYSNEINNITKAFHDISKEWGKIIDSSIPTSEIPTILSNIYNQFHQLLQDVIALIDTALGNKIYSDSELSSVLFIDHPVVDNLNLHYDNTLKKLFALREYSQKLQNELQVSFVKNCRSLMFDYFSDLDDVLRDFEYLSNCREYKKQLGKFKAGRCPEPDEPRIRRRTFGKRQSLNLQDRRHAIYSLFWLEGTPEVAKLDFRDLRPHCIILIRQTLEIMWRDLIGFDGITDSSGNIIKKHTQIGWKFIMNYHEHVQPSMKAVDPKGKWHIEFPIDILVIDRLNTWCNHFTHNPYVPPLYITYYATELLTKLSHSHPYNGSWTNDHGDIFVKGLHNMQQDFEEFVKANSTQPIQINWLNPSQYRGAYLI